MPRFDSRRQPLLAAAAVLAMLVMPGCSPAPETPAANASSGRDASSAAEREASEPASAGAETASETLPPTIGEPEVAAADPPSASRGGRSAGNSGGAAESAEKPAPPVRALPLAGASAGSGGPAGSSEPPKQLRDDLTPEELVRFLAEADAQMARIASGTAGIRDEEKALAEMRKTIALKLEASRRLIDHEQAGPEALKQGRRGELQALSHLASLGDLESAERLETLATSYLQSGDTELETDSRLVLIGFAIETLRHGKEGAADRITEQVDELAQHVSSSNLPAMVVMGQAREVLQLYEYNEQAQQVRSVIIEHFADSPDPQIARMAAELAGSVRYDAIDRMRAEALAGEAVSQADWRAAAEQLIEASADLLTVRYLAGAALEFEAAGLNGLAETTYALLEQRFDDRSTARDREAQYAVAAREARQAVVGRQFDPDLEAVDGSELPFDTFRGQVVLMPFWNSRFPDSLQVLPRLREIRDAHPDQVAIVGMNLDLEGAPVEAFIREQGFDFPSYRSESSPTAPVPNDVAARFGLVSFPFTVIFDRQGRVAAIDLNGQTIAETVEGLLQGPGDEETQPPEQTR